VYIRNLIPDDMSIPRRRFWGYRGRAMRQVNAGAGLLRIPTVSNTPG
jgi:hypothetical protein